MYEKVKDIIMDSITELVVEKKGNWDKSPNIIMDLISELINFKMSDSTRVAKKLAY